MLVVAKCVHEGMVEIRFFGGVYPGNVLKFDDTFSMYHHKTHVPIFANLISLLSNQSVE